MNEDTPLTEVAHHLPASTASMLGECSEEVQEFVLEQLRTFIVSIEEVDVRLDPVQYAGVMSSAALLCIASGKQLIALARGLGQTHRQLHDLHIQYADLLGERGGDS